MISLREREDIAHERVQRALVRDDDHLRHAEPLEHGLYAVRLLAGKPVDLFFFGIFRSHVKYIPYF